jgi:predicted TIM-barrel fold metal-dependent hydrolase
LRESAGIEQALVVGYEGAPWAAGNNRYLAEQVAIHSWIKPVAYVSDPARLDERALAGWQKDRFVGVSMYLFGDDVSALEPVSDEVWAWIARKHWLVSVNSTGEHWTAWVPILERHPELTLLVSHLGLPNPVTDAPDMTTARHELATVCSLAHYAGVHVKLSGFYALTKPGYGYPHRAAWPYVEVLLEAFGSSRLLWGSDYSPSLEWVSFPQTYALLDDMPLLNEADRRRIEGENLLALLARV